MNLLAALEAPGAEGQRVSLDLPPLDLQDLALVYGVEDTPLLQDEGRRVPLEGLPVLHRPGLVQGYPHPLARLRRLGV
jgi:hypothetical protein